MRLLFVLSFIVICTSCDSTEQCDESSGYIECWDGSRICDLIENCPDQTENNYSFSIGEVNNQYIAILYSHEGSPPNIGGFQFDFSGATVTEANGGAAENAGFSISTTESSPTILGFSFTGSTIPNGNNGDILTKLFYIGEITNIDLCINNIIISDSQGNEISALLIECN